MGKMTLDYNMPGKNQTTGPVPVGDPMQAEFIAPDPLPDLTRSNGSVEVKQTDQLAADFTVSLNGKFGKTDSQNVRISFRNNKELRPGRNVVTITSKFGSGGFNVLLKRA